MNDLFRIFENFDPMTAAVAAPKASGSIDSHAFAIRFADASSAMDEELLDGEPLAPMASEKEDFDSRPSDLALVSKSSDSSNLSPALPIDAELNSPPATITATVGSQQSELKGDDLVQQRNAVAPITPAKISRSGQFHSGVQLVEPSTAHDPKGAMAAPASRHDLPESLKPTLDNRLDKIAVQKSVMELTATEDASPLMVRSNGPINLGMSSGQSTAPFPMIEIADPANIVVRGNKASITPGTTLDMESGDQWIARLGQEVSRLTGEKTALSFQLKPHNLGKLHVEITSDIAGNVVRVETDNENAKQLILGAQGRLEQDIRLSGSKLVRVDVTSQEQSQPQTSDHSADSQARGTAMEQRKYAATDEHLAEPIALAPSDADASRSPFGARYA